MTNLVMMTTIMTMVLVVYNETIRQYIVILLPKGKSHELIINQINKK